MKRIVSKIVSLVMISMLSISALSLTSAVDDDATIVAYDGQKEEYISDYQQTDDRELFEIVDDLPSVSPKETLFENAPLDAQTLETFRKADLLDETGSLDFDKFAQLPTIDEERSLSAVIGTDDRTLVPNTLAEPYRYIVYILSEYNGKYYRGTGFMVGPNAVGTCAHNLHSSERGWASNITVFAARNGNVAPFGSAQKKKLYVSSQWIKTASYESDWGLVELDNNLGDKTGYFGIRSYSRRVVGKTAVISGYPAVALGASTSQMYTHSDTIKTQDGKRIFYEIDTTGGNSGSPVYVEKDLLIGIHAYGGSINSGRRIDKVIYEFYKSFR